MDNQPENGTKVITECYLDTWDANITLVYTIYSSREFLSVKISFIATF